MSFKFKTDFFWFKSTTSGLFMFGQRERYAHVSIPLVKRGRFRGIHWTPRPGVHLTPDELKGSWSKHQARMDQLIEPLREYGRSLPEIRTASLDELIALECEFFEMDVSHGGPPPWEHREVRAEEIRMPAKPGVLQFSYHPSGIGMCEPPGSSTSGTWHFFSIDLARAWEIAESAVKDAEKRDPEFFAGIRRIAGWMVRG